MQEFKDTTPNSQAEEGATRASARLPGLDIEITCRRATDGTEHVSINLMAAPSFEAFGRALEATNPFAFWAQAWLPWLETARTLALPWPRVTWLPKPPGDTTS